MVKSIVIRRAVFALVPCGAGVSVVSAESQVVNGTPLQIWMKAIAQRFSPCVGPFGVLAELPTVNGLPDETLGSIQLATPGITSDGYYQSIHIHGPSNSAFIVQTGGIAGHQTVYGPVSLRFQCQKEVYLRSRNGSESLIEDSVAYTPKSALPKKR